MIQVWLLNGQGSRWLGFKEEQQVWVVWAKESSGLKLGFWAWLSLWFDDASRTSLGEFLR